MLVWVRTSQYPEEVVDFRSTVLVGRHVSFGIYSLDTYIMFSLGEGAIRHAYSTYLRMLKRKKEQKGKTSSYLLVQKGEVDTMRYIKPFLFRKGV